MGQALMPKMEMAGQHCTGPQCESCCHVYVECCPAFRTHCDLLTCALHVTVEHICSYSGECMCAGYIWNV